MEVVFSLLALLIIASFVHVLARKIQVPYTIFLFIVGIFLSPLFSFLGIDWSLALTPDLLFYLFLPVLIFESGYHINRHHLHRSRLTIWTMASVGYLLSAGLIGGGGYLILSRLGYTIPFSVMLLFGIIISATDPVAVLSLFKKLGTPHKLNLLFEGESLFNDGTAVAAFLIGLELFLLPEISGGMLWQGLGHIVVMIVGGIILGILLGFVFSHVLSWIKNNESAEITLTMVLAHLTFVVAEYINQHVALGGFDLHISAIIATAFSAIVMGNYGKTKISPKVEVYMDKFRSFFSFICNSFVFLLMGFLLWESRLPFDAIRLPLFVSIVVLILARALSIYIPLGLLHIMHKKYRLPRSWMHLLAWGSLRGAISLVLVLLIPESYTISGRGFDYSIRDFLLVMVMGSIVFSLLVKGLSMPWLIRRLGLDQLRQLETFERIETEILVYYAILEKIQLMADDYDLCAENYEKLEGKYRRKLHTAQNDMKQFLAEQSEPDVFVQDALMLHALGVEKQYLKEMYHYHECSESIFVYMMGKLERQTLRLEQGHHQFSLSEKNPSGWQKTDWLFRLLRLCGRKDSYIDNYVVKRCRYIICSKVLSLLEDYQSKKFGYDPCYLDPIIEQYQIFQQNAENEISKLQKKHPECVTQIHTKLLNKGLMKTEERIVEELLQKDIITHKVYQLFIKEIDKEIDKEVEGNVIR